VNTPSVTTSMRVLADTFEPKRYAQADHLPSSLPKSLRHAVGGRARAIRRGLQHQDFTALLHGLAVQDQRHARGLAGAGRREPARRNGAGRAARRERQQGFVDGEALVIAR
jgi:hypothetical protein